jgi:hypothetical protein
LPFYAQFLPSHGITDEIATHSSFFVISCNQYFVIMTAAAENPVLHTHVVTKGSKIFIAMFDNLG